MWRDIKYLKKGRCTNVPNFTGDGVAYEKHIDLHFHLGDGGTLLTFKKDGTFVIVGTFNTKSSKYTNNKWVYLNESCIIGITLDSIMLAVIKKSPVTIDFDNSLQYDEHKNITVKYTVAGVLSSEITVSLKK